MSWYIHVKHVEVCSGWELHVLLANDVIGLVQPIPLLIGQRVRGSPSSGSPAL